ncbi:MAG: DNA primase [Limnothrix sp. RL_2_0]|nr:DNA primase [Limnothrix sp. RL_2_0]
MANPAIHPDTIEDVRQRVDITEVVSDYVVLKKRGKDLLGLCPFHDEKTPSFTVSPSKQFYHCFGCQAGGNAIKFLMEINKNSFAEVVLELTRRYQIPLKTLEPEQREEIQRQLSLKEQLYEIVAIAASFYQYALRQPQGEIALNYVLKDRQLSEETIQKFGIGYAPGGWETLYRYLVEQKRYPIALVEEAGLIKPRQSGSGHYDQFRDRLMIPIHDTQGRAIAFGSRTLTGEEPKYLNSPETPLFSKSFTLFALDKAKTAIAKQDQAIVVEGYFDAIALHAAGFEQAVASLGTAFTQGQVKQLLRYTESKQIILNFDADKAGIKATQRALTEIEPLIYSGQVQARVLNLPGGKDADEFLLSEQGIPNYKTALEEAPLWIDWQLQQLLLGQDLNEADQMQKIGRKSIRILAKIQDQTLRSHYISTFAQAISNGDRQHYQQLQENFYYQVKRLQKSLRQKEESPAEIEELPVATTSITLVQAEELLLRLYLHNAPYRRQIETQLTEQQLMFSLSHNRWLWQQIIEIPTETKQNLLHNQLLGKILDILTNYPDKMQILGHLLYLNEKKEIDVFRVPLQIRAAIATMERVNWAKHRSYCLEQWKNLDASHKDYGYYLQEFYQADKKLKEIDAERNFSNLEIIRHEV